MADDGFTKAKDYLGVAVLDLIPRMAEIMDLISEWALGHDAAPLFEEAQGRHIAFGEVQSVPKVAANPQFEHRGFYEPVAWDGPPSPPTGPPGPAAGHARPTAAGTGRRPLGARRDRGGVEPPAGARRPCRAAGHRR